MILAITPEELQEACRVIYGPDGYKDVPAQIFYDHFAGHPSTTFIRVSFPSGFRVSDLTKLEKLRALLEQLHGNASVVFCLYYNLMDRQDMERHTIDIATR